MKKTNLGKVIMWSAIVAAGILIGLLFFFKETSTSCFHLITGIASIIGSVATAATVLFLAFQMKQQRDKDNTELVFNLYREFYNNPSHSKLFSIIDFDYDKKCDNEVSLNQILEIIIRSEPFELNIANERSQIEEHFEIDLPEETDLSNYMNFFNALGKLIEENKELMRTTENIFNYQLKKTLTHPILINYLIDGDFKGILAFNHKIRIPFFFYGTLKDPKERKKNIGAWEWEPNVECTLFGYAILDISDEEGTYPALIKAENSSVMGIYSEVQVTNFFEFFTAIDDYEAVGDLYERRLDWVHIDASSEKKLCWIYIKK
jgi:hypothetical protein